LGAGRSHDQRAISSDGFDAHPAGVDHAPIAEWLPERYRNVLDRIADLEASGRHADGDRIRRAAIRAYSRRWNERTAQRLDDLAGEAIQLAATSITTKGHRGAGLLRRRGRVTAPAASPAHEALSAERPTA
jgi:hypothetical protein